MGWKAKGLIERLEEKRIARAADWYTNKQDKDAKRAKVAADLAKGPAKSIFENLEKLGY